MLDVFGSVARWGVVVIAVLTPHASMAAQCLPGTDKDPLKGELVITTSGGALTDSLKEIFWNRFEKECGVKVVSYPVPGRTISQTLTLIESGNTPFDVVLTLTPDEYPLLRKAGALQPLPEGLWDGVSDKLTPGAIDDYGVWSAPYSTLLLYSKAKFPNEGMKGWADFWDTKKFPGPRILQNSPLNLVIALLSLGVDPKDVYPLTDDKIAKAFIRLNEIRPHVKTFWSAADQPIQGVGSGEFVAGSAWNGRITVGQRQGLPLGTAWKGNLIATSTWVIPKGSKNPKAAAAYLRFLYANLDYVAEYATKMNYAQPRIDVVKLLPKEVSENLPLNPENMAGASVVDAQWWADNNARMAAIWQTWVATGKYDGKR